MIRIEIGFDERGRIVDLAVVGHSGTAERGKDIVCAGVSAIVQTALLGVLQQLKHPCEYEVDSGVLRLVLKDSPTDSTEAVLQTMLLGLGEIAKQNPQAVKIHRKSR